MKKVLLAAIVVAGMMSSCKTEGFRITKHHEPLTEESRRLTGFERIELLGSLDVKYMQADSFSVIVKAPKDVISHVVTRVEGNKLMVNMKGGDRVINLGMADSDDVTVYVTSPDFLGIELKGSGDFDCIQLLDTDTLDIVLKGSGDIEFDDILCDRVNVSLVGSGDVEVKRVKTQQSRVELVGSGDIKMRFDDSGWVESRLTGSGDIELKGTVKDHKYQVRGSGDMHVKELRVMNY